MWGNFGVPIELGDSGRVVAAIDCPLFDFRPRRVYGVWDRFSPATSCGPVENSLSIRRQAL